jgi:hypothetical protein
MQLQRCNIVLQLSQKLHSQELSAEPNTHANSSEGKCTYAAKGNAHTTGRQNEGKYTDTHGRCYIIALRLLIVSHCCFELLQLLLQRLDLLWSCQEMPDGVHQGSYDTQCLT